MSNSAINVALVQGKLQNSGTSNNLNSIQSAMAGGQPLANFLSQQIPQTLFMQEIGQGKISIINSTIGFQNKQGEWVEIMPVTFALAGQGDNEFSMVMHGKVSKQVWQQMAGSASLTINPNQELYIKDYPSYHQKWRFDELVISRLDSESNGSDDDDECMSHFTYNEQNYCIFGSLETTLSYSQEPLWVAPTTLGALGLLSAIPFGKTAFSEFIVPCMKSCWKAQSEIWGNMGGTLDFNATSALLDSSTEAASTEAIAEEGAEIAITAAGAVCFGVLVALVLVPIVVDLVEHYSYNNIQIYNLSNKHDMTWDLPFIANSGTMTQAPILSDDDTDYEQLIPGDRSESPKNWIQPQQGYGSGAFSFASNGGMSGVGEAFGLKFFKMNPNATTASDYDDVVPDGYGAISVNIPWTGDNDIACTMTNAPMSSNGYWYSRSPQQVTSLSTQLAELGLQMTISIDYLNGTHPESNGNLAYYYQSIVVISDIT